jgi:hypothetical protein
LNDFFLARIKDLARGIHAAYLDGTIGTMEPVRPLCVSSLDNPYRSS